MTRLRPALQLLLVALMVITGQAMAVARGQASAAGQMEFCRGSGTVMVWVDARGRPTGSPHLCPDGALTHVVSAPEAQVPPPREGRLAVVSPVWPRLAAAGRARPVPSARAPPGQV